MHVYIEQGLQAHFFQPDGTSRPGTEWAVMIDDGASAPRVLVRAYADDTAGLTTADEAAAVIAFVESQLAEGWRPTDAVEPLTFAKPPTGWPGSLGLSSHPDDNSRTGPASWASRETHGSARYWFPAKRYGWGWGLPSTWEGWATMAIWIGILIASSIVLLPRHPFAHGGVVLASIASLFGICFAKGEPPRWRWGD